jgi:hypothetical protein
MPGTGTDMRRTPNTEHTSWPALAAPSARPTSSNATECRLRATTNVWQGRKFERPLCVDHCHEMKEVRALLCLKCNLGAGYYEHNPVFLRNAADVMEDWLKRHPQLRSRKKNK